MFAITKRAGTITPITGIGVDWSGTAAASGSDDAYATANATTDSQSAEPLWFTNFGFPVFDFDVEVLGIEVGIEWHHENDGECDADIQMIVAGALEGDIRASATANETTDASEVFGADDDLWSIADLSVQDVALSNFGVAVLVNFEGVLVTNNTAKFDDLFVTVYYSGSPGGEDISNQQAIGPTRITEVVGY